MTEHPDVTVLLQARTTFEAQVIAGILRQADIPAYVGGRSLQDPHAISQALANVSYVAVHVPTDRLEEARRAVAEAAEGREILERPNFDPGPPVENDVEGAGDDDGAH